MACGVLSRIYRVYRRCIPNLGAMHGWLWKKSGASQWWNARWCVLRRGKMELYSQPPPYLAELDELHASRVHTAWYRAGGPRHRGPEGDSSKIRLSSSEERRSKGTHRSAIEAFLVSRPT